MNSNPAVGQWIAAVGASIRDQVSQSNTSINRSINEHVKPLKEPNRAVSQPINVNDNYLDDEESQDFNQAIKQSVQNSVKPAASRSTSLPIKQTRQQAMDQTAKESATSLSVDSSDCTRSLIDPSFYTLLKQIPQSNAASNSDSSIKFHRTNAPKHRRHHSKTISPSNQSIKSSQSNSQLNTQCTKFDATNYDDFYDRDDCQCKLCAYFIVEDSNNPSNCQFSKKSSPKKIISRTINQPAKQSNNQSAKPAVKQSKEQAIEQASDALSKLHINPDSEDESPLSQMNSPDQFDNRSIVSTDSERSSPYDSSPSDASIKPIIPTINQGLKSPMQRYRHWRPSPKTVNRVLGPAAPRPLHRSVTQPIKPQRAGPTISENK